jgi:hypothetical protein
MFYRVISGIRERQNSHGGVPIYEQRDERLENSYPPRWINHNVAAMDAVRVTPFESSPGDSLQHGDRVGGSVALLPPSVRTSMQKDNGWSITGFDEDPQEPRQYSIIEEDTIDDAVFEMDL